MSTVGLSEYYQTNIKALRLCRRCVQMTGVVLTTKLLTGFPKMVYAGGEKLCDWLVCLWVLP